MLVSHVADDYAAIARRLKEIQDESRQLEEKPQKAARHGDIGYQLNRSRQIGDESTKPRR